MRNAVKNEAHIYKNEFIGIKDAALRMWFRVRGDGQWQEFGCNRNTYSLLAVEEKKRKPAAPLSVHWCVPHTHIEKYPNRERKVLCFFFLVFPIALKDMTQLNSFLSFPSKTAPPNAPAKQSQNRNRSSRIHLILNQPHGTKLCRAADGPHTIDYNSI